MENAMARAYQILSTFTDEELQGFIMMFNNRKINLSTETEIQRKARKKVAFDRIIAKRIPVSPNFDEKQELLNYLDERFSK